MPPKTLSRTPLIILSVVLLCSLLFGIHRYVHPAGKLPFPAPVEGEENEKLREMYDRLRHRTAPGTDWQLIEKQNMEAAMASRSNNPTTFGVETFANGAISGEWHERGANNQAGSVRAIDYVPLTNTLYNISNGGSLWSSVLGSGSWILRNQSVRFNQRTIRAFTKTGGGTRILLSTNQTVYYSDDEGQTITPSTGIEFPVEWAGNYIASLTRLNDAGHTVYCLTRPWSANPWGARFWLYRSTDEGVTFTKIFEFEAGNDDRLSLCNPYNTTVLYAADISSVANSIRLYSISGSSVTIANTYNVGIVISNCALKGTKVGSTTTLYAMLNNNTLYRSTNTGSSWSLRSSLPENGWMKMNVSPSNADLVSFGGVNAFRSTTGGTDWTKVNEWYDYYGNVSSKLHADIMEIEYFKKTDNTEFAIINSHGGTFTSYDNLLTVSNQSLTSHVAVEYYDVLTDTLHPNRIFTGAQDQGLQRTLTATSPGIQDFTQVISGDYGQMNLTHNNEFLWPQYPGGTYYLYNNLGNATPDNIAYWQMPGTQIPNFGWMLAATSTANAAANEIWIGGGNINGGGGSYLSKLTLSTNAPYTVTPTQIDYDFRANSTAGNAGITAVEQSLVNPNKLFVATEDGTFFYSNNLGGSWNKTASFDGPDPWYLYGSCILASRKNENLLWYSGSGYSNAPVYKSVDGGTSFSPMSNGLPATLVNEIVASPDEKFLYAATEAGPYVYVGADDQWYSLSGSNTPVQFFTSVEYIASQNIVRFGTMGRGIWDFNVTLAASNYTFIGDGNWSDSSYWLNKRIPPKTLSNGAEIIIDPAGNGECVLNVEQHLSGDSRITVMGGKKFRVTGSVTISQTPGAALNFDGADDYVSIPNNNALNVSKVTIETWVNWSNTTTSIDFICGKNYEELEIHTGGGSGSNGIRFIPTSGVYLDGPANILPTGAWTHIAFVYDPSIALAKLYVNGVEKTLINHGFNPLTTPITTSVANLNLGRRSNITFPFKGKLDEFRMWNRVLTQAEIQNTMNCELNNPQNGLLVYFKFNHGVAGSANPGKTNATDASGNGLNGNLINFSLSGDVSNWVAPGGVVSGKACN